MGKRPALSLASVQRAEGVTLFAFPWDFEEDTGASIVQDFSGLSQIIVPLGYFINKVLYMV